MATKVVQLDMFVNTQKEKENLEKKERDKMIERSFRAAFFRLNELETTILDFQRKLEKIMELVNEKELEKTP